MNRWGALFFACFAAIVIGAASWVIYTRSGPPYHFGAFVEVVNADTLNFEKGTVQLRTADAPEPLQGSKCSEERELGIRAMEMAQKLTENKPNIKVVNIDTSQGVFNRWHADVLVDGEDLGRKLIESGLARETNDAKALDWCEVS